MGPPNRVNYNQPPGLLEFLVGHVFVKNVVCSYVVLDMVFLCLGSLLGRFWTPTWAQKPPNMGSKSHSWNHFLLIPANLIFEHPSNENHRFFVQGESWETQLRLKNKIWKQDVFKVCFKMYFWPTRTQHKPNLGLKLAPSWPQDGPKTKLTPRWPALAQVGLCWHMLVQNCLKLTPK